MADDRMTGDQEMVNGVVEDDPLDDDDFTGMPQLCDNEKVAAAAAASKAEQENRLAASAEASGDANTEPVRSGKVDEWEDILGSGRIRKKIVIPGTGERPERGARVVINVQESLSIESEIIKDDQRLEFNVGESEVLQALDLVVPLMNIGESSIVESDSDFCYGDMGDPPRVGSKSKLCLRVELVSATVLPPAPDIPLDERARIGNEKRLRGNNWYARGEHSQAVQCYRKAVEYLDDESIDVDVEVPIDRFLLPRNVLELLENRVKAYNNMAQAQMKLTAWDSALASIKQVLKLEPNNEKALFRKAKVLQEKYRGDEAIGILRRVTRLYPSNKQAQIELSAMLAKQRKGKQKEQALSRKMLGIVENPATSKNSNFSRQTKLIIACVGGMGALFGALLAKTYQLF